MKPKIPCWPGFWPVIIEDQATEEISGIAGDSGVITKGISECIVEFDGTTNDIIPQGQIAGTDTLLNVPGMDIPADHPEEEAGAKLTDVRFFPV